MESINKKEHRGAKIIWHGEHLSGPRKEKKTKKKKKKTKKKKKKNESTPPE
jgi:hypothetical protein